MNVLCQHRNFITHNLQILDPPIFREPQLNKLYYVPSCSVGIRNARYSSVLYYMRYLNQQIYCVSKKQLQMVDAWGGWSLFQELLRTLKTVANKHGVSIPTVAVRFILDQVFSSFPHFLAYWTRTISLSYIHRQYKLGWPDSLKIYFTLTVYIT